MDNYKVKLIQMIQEMQEHEVIYAFAYLSRMLGHEYDPEGMTRRDVYIAETLENLQKLNDNDLYFIDLMAHKLLREQEKSA